MRMLMVMIVGLMACGTEPSGENKPPGVDITIASDGQGFWKIAVANKRDVAIRIAWDSSSYVASDGKSLGRLIRGNTRRMDLGNPQPPAPVAPHASMEETVIPESYARLDDGLLTANIDETGTVYLAMETDTEKFTRKGKSAPDPARVPLTEGHYCAVSKRSGIGGTCRRAIAFCENGRKTAVRGIPIPVAVDDAIGPCEKVATAYCFDHTPKLPSGVDIKVDKSELCAPTAFDCSKDRGTLATSSDVTECEERH